jgi:hypothetical protein
VQSPIPWAASSCLRISRTIRPSTTKPVPCTYTLSTASSVQADWAMAPPRGALRTARTMCLKQVARFATLPLRASDRSSRDCLGTAKASVRRLIGITGTGGREATRAPPAPYCGQSHRTHFTAWLPRDVDLSARHRHFQRVGLTSQSPPRATGGRPDRHRQSGYVSDRSSM